MTLHCPATLLIARHGDAAYAAANRVMSDDGGWLTAKGRSQVGDLADRLTHDKVAATYSSTLSRAAESGELAAGRLVVRQQSRPGLEEVRVGECAGRPFGDPSFQHPFDQWLAGDLEARIPGAESGHEVLDRFRAALQGIADEHRGETVLVFTHGGVMSFAVPRLADNVANDLALGTFLPNAVPARLEVGDDGWRLLEWPGVADKRVV